MSGEIRQTLRMQHVPSNTTKVPSNSGTLSVDQVGTRRDGQIQTIGTVEEVLDIAADIATSGGKLMMRNMDATNFVDVGFATGVYPLRLVAGDVMMVLSLAAAQTVYVKADTAAIALDWEIFEK